MAWKVSDLMRTFRVDPKMGGMAEYATKGGAKTLVGGAADPVIKLKREIERLLGEYEPVLVGANLNPLTNIRINCRNRVYFILAI